MHAIAPPYSRASDRQLGTNLDSKKKRKKEGTLSIPTLWPPIPTGPLFLWLIIWHFEPLYLSRKVSQT